MVLRSNFNSSRLVRLLQDMAREDAVAPRQDIAERLGLWVDAFDAMTLHAAHQSIKTLDAAQAKARRAAGPAVGVGEQLHQVRAVLAQAIAAKDAARAGGKPPRHLRAQPEPAPERGTETEADYAPYRQRHAELQRNMELMIAPLREHVRQALSDASPALRQLAALDAVWEQLLAAREKRLLATVPKRMEKRFKHLRLAHRQDEDPLGWLDAFGQEWQQMVLAELSARLEPVVGLVEAFSNQVESVQ